MAKAELDVTALVKETFEKHFGVTLDRLRELAEADKDGRLAVLPCKVGDTVYWLNNWHRTYGDYKIEEAVVSNIRVTDNGLWIGFYSGENVSEEQFGKYVFLTREAAEKALEDMHGPHCN